MWAESELAKYCRAGSCQRSDEVIVCNTEGKSSGSRFAKSLLTFEGLVRVEKIGCRPGEAMQFQYIRFFNHWRYPGALRTEAGTGTFVKIGSEPTIIHEFHLVNDSPFAKARTAFM